MCFSNFKTINNLCAIKNVRILFSGYFSFRFIIYCRATYCVACHVQVLYFIMTINCFYLTYYNLLCNSEIATEPNV